MEGGANVGDSNITSLFWESLFLKENGHELTSGNSFLLFGLFHFLDGSVCSSLAGRRRRRRLQHREQLGGLAHDDAVPHHPPGAVRVAVHVRGGQQGLVGAAQARGRVGRPRGGRVRAEEQAHPVGEGVADPEGG